VLIAHPSRAIDREVDLRFAAAHEVSVRMIAADCCSRESWEEGRSVPRESEAPRRHGGDR
jgi:hypothetical protein